MFILMMQKLLHKKWMVFCILIGNILLIAISVSQPLYQASAFQRMFQDDCDRYLEEKGKWPTQFNVEQTTSIGVKSVGPDLIKKDVDYIIDEVGIPVKEYVTSYTINNVKATANVVRDGNDDKLIKLSAMSDFMEHIDIIYGEMPNPEMTKDGYIEVIVSEAAMVNLDLLIGDEYEYSYLKDNNGDFIKIRVVGAFKAKDDSQLYWVTPDSELKTEVFVPMSTFQTLFSTDKEFYIENSIVANWYIFWDYSKIQASEASDYYKSYEKAITEKSLKGKANATEYYTILKNYNAKVNRVEATLFILQVPLILLLCAFLYMISGQMLQMEQNEISLMKSRGSTKLQIVLLYLMQSSILAAFSLIIGIPVGKLICTFLGNSTAFLEFSTKQSLKIIYTNEVFIYAGIAVLIAIAMTTIPVIKYSGITIVNLKQTKAKNRKSFWKKAYLDMICLGLSLYGYFSFHMNEENMMEKVLQGKPIDPLLYISFSLFILGAGLFVCRLQPFIMKVIYKFTQKRLKPAAYASLLETIRTSYKQEFIILFMILTVAIGISNTTIARTINANTTTNARHVLGGEMVMEELWGNNIKEFQAGVADKVEYYEPDFSKYTMISGTDSITKVLNRNVKIIGQKEENVANLMGIQVSGFSEVTQMKEGLLPFSYYDYLNVLVSDQTGFIVSENFMTDLGYKLGDTVSFYDNWNNSVTGPIRGFFSYWPTFKPYEYSVSNTGSLQKKNQYFAVGNLSTIQKSMGLYPYQIWMNVKDGGEGIEHWINDNSGVKLLKVQDREKIIDNQLQDTLIQGTNGILSMSFIVILLLCCIGYLIYWIVSIRSRELLFGVLRAMGMKKMEITWMLVIEQICSGLFAIIAGGFIGIISSIMFVPMIQKAYAAADQVLPMEMVSKTSDIVQLFVVIGIVLCICFWVLGKIISKMNISNALKLGED